MVYGGCANIWAMSLEDEQLKELQRVTARTLIESLKAVSEALDEAGFTASKLTEMVAQSEVKDKQNRARNETWYERHQSKQQHRFKRY